MPQEPTKLAAEMWPSHRCQMSRTRAVPRSRGNLEMTGGGEGGGLGSGGTEKRSGDRQV